MKLWQVIFEMIPLLLVLLVIVVVGEFVIEKTQKAATECPTCEIWNGDLDELHIQV